MNNQVHFNKTKIVATIGPKSSSKDVLRQMLIAGVDVCRLNFSHGSYDEHQEVIKFIRELNDELSLHTALLVDLQGPKLRIGVVENNAVEIKEGQTLVFTTEKCEGNASKVYITYPQFPKDVRKDEIILVDDGKMQFKVTATNGTDTVTAVALNGGILSSKKGVNLPNTKISLPCLTEKDLADLQFALEQNVDWVGLSFVRNASDILELKQIINRAKKNARVIAKIEKPEAVSDIEQIIYATDAVMVARGDLGVEIPMEEVPLIQKSVVTKCVKSGKPVIIATQMMESMITNISPTRAEVNDVANSVMDGADAVMLSGETSVGAYPVRVVEIMRNIISTVENNNYIYNRNQNPDPLSPSYLPEAICHQATVIASNVNATAIVGMSSTGFTAQKAACQRPTAPIYVFTDEKHLLTTLNLIWGVRALYYAKYVSTDETIMDLHNILKQSEYVKPGDIVVNIASIPMEERGKANMIKVTRIKA